MQRKIKILGFLFALIFVPNASAEVIASSENHLKLTFVLNVKSSLENLDKTFIQISTWWNPDHSYSGKSENLYIDIANSHCFCEKLKDGGLVRHLDLVFSQPQKRYRFVGGLGPLQTIPVSGVLDFSFQKVDDQSTQLKVTYHVSTNGGFLKGWDNPVNQVIQEQLNRLKVEAEK